jgi:hypothetical protein
MGIKGSRKREKAKQNRERMEMLQIKNDRIHVKGFVGEVQQKKEIEKEKEKKEIDMNCD